jgi:hypothetical protein
MFKTALIRASAILLAMTPVVARAQVRRSGTLIKPDSVRVARPVGVIDGVVSDTNLVPLRGAFVSVLGTKIRVGTGPNGRFRILDVPTGRYLMIVRRAGYHPTSSVVDVAAADTARLAYTLAEGGPTLLEPVVVTAKTVTGRLSEFEARRKLGVGEFMTADEIDRKNTVFATELFRNFQSINVSPSRTNSMPEYYALSKREGGSIQTGACPMQVYLDKGALATTFNLDLLPPPR